MVLTPMLQALTADGADVDVLPCCGAVDLAGRKWCMLVVRRVLLALRAVDGLPDEQPMSARSNVRTLCKKPASLK